MPDSKAVSLDQRPAWQALQAHYNQIRSRHLKAMFDEDPKVHEFLSLPGAAVEHKIRRLLELVGEYLKASSNLDPIG